jgi:sugar transferase (PEP-CTERM/EpsH1 system associated)
MREILFLSHRIPYPPDKGDKIRSYNLLKGLSERYRVHLGTFVDDAADWQHVADLRRICAETCILPLDPRWARARSLLGLLSGRALTMAYYDSRRLCSWVRDLARSHRLAGAYVYSSCMGPYAADLDLGRGAVRIMDFCDIDSDKWRQYAPTHGYPMKWVFAREARMLARAESELAAKFDASLVISEAEAGILRSIAPCSGDRVAVLPNGVDAEYFDPGRCYDNPFQSGGRRIVFTGAMDYHANVDAVTWFARDVFPTVRRRLPDAVFVIVGSNPTLAVRQLASLPGVEVTRRVPDVRPYLAHASAVVAPLRIARGVQNKVLEALAMARPVIATENALQGIPDAGLAGVITPADPGAFADAVITSLEAALAEPRGRAFVLDRFVWKAQASKLAAYFSGSGEETIAGAPLAVARA